MLCCGIIQNISLYDQRHYGLLYIVYAFAGIRKNI